MVYLTGDCHGDWRKFGSKKLTDQKNMNKEDVVIVLGDFGLWHDCPSERYWLDFLSKKPFTTVFLDGNHENFDRLNSNEFEIVDFHGGKAHKIRENIYHLMRGYVFTFGGKRFFVFGGAQSHDISDGILRVEDYKSARYLWQDYNRRIARNEMIRVEHSSWWKEELPTEEELQRGTESLRQHGNSVDYVLSHCAPTHIAAMMGFSESDILCRYFEAMDKEIDYKMWYFGHYHREMRIDDRHECLYHSIIRIL